MPASHSLARVKDDEWSHVFFICMFAASGSSSGRDIYPWKVVIYTTAYSVQLTQVERLFVASLSFPALRPAVFGPQRYLPYICIQRNSVSGPSFSRVVNNSSDGNKCSSKDIA